jgi:hypothetical protein
MSTAVAHSTRSGAAAQAIEFTRALDGARILVRHFLSKQAPHERWVREFSTDGLLVRISVTRKATDAGQWFRTYDLRCEAVLEESRAPALREPKKLNSPTSERSEGQSSFEGMEDE